MDPNSLFPVVENGNWGYIDEGGTLAIKPTFEVALPFCEGLARVAVGSTWGYFGPSGNIVQHPGVGWWQESVLTELTMGRFALKWGFIDPRGELIVEPCFEWARDFSCHRALVQVDGKTGFIDREGNLVIEPQYARASSFSENRASVQVDGKVGFIDRSGIEIIPPRYEEAKSFSEGKAAVKLAEEDSGDKWGM